MTSWPLAHINFQISSELRHLELIGMLTVSSQISTNFHLQAYSLGLVEVFPGTSYLPLLINLNDLVE